MRDESGGSGLSGASNHCRHLGLPFDAFFSHRPTLAWQRSGHRWRAHLVLSTTPTTAGSYEGTPGAVCPARRGHAGRLGIYLSLPRSLQAHVVDEFAAGWCGSMTSTDRSVTTGSPVAALREAPRRSSDSGKDPPWRRRHGRFRRRCRVVDVQAAPVLGAGTLFTAERVIQRERT